MFLHSYRLREVELRGQNTDDNTFAYMLCNKSGCLVSARYIALRVGIILV